MKVDQDTKETQERRDTEDEEAVVGKSFTDQSLSEPRNHHSTQQTTRRREHQLHNQEAEYRHIDLLTTWK